MGSIVSARRAGSTHASNPTTSITADVRIRAFSTNDIPASPPIPTTNRMKRFPATMPPPTRRTAREKIPTSSRPGTGAEGRPQPNLACPPRHCHRHQREDSRRRQKQPKRHHTGERRRRDHRRQVDTPRPIIEPPHLFEPQARINGRRNGANALGEGRGIGADTDAHGQRRHRARPRRVKYERRFTQIRGRRPDVAHHADDFQPLLGRRRVRDRVSNATAHGTRAIHETPRERFIHDHVSRAGRQHRPQ